MRKLTEDEVVAAIHEYQNGYSAAKVGAHYGVRGDAILYLLRRHGIPRRSSTEHQQKLQEDHKSAIVADYLSGLSSTAVASKFGIDKSTVCDVLRARGVKARSPSAAHRHYALDESVFDTVNEQSAYWLGFLMADGCISDSGGRAELILQLKASDLEHVEAFRAFLHSTRPIRVIPPRGYKKSWNSQPSAAFCVNSKSLVAALSRHGVVPRKSFRAEAPTGLKYDRHFWRGLVDGDGWVCLVRGGVYPLIGLTGPRPLIEQWSEFIRSIAPSTKASVNPNGPIWRCVTTGRFAVAVIRVLYENCHVALPRKLDIATRILAR